MEVQVVPARGGADLERAASIAAQVLGEGGLVVHPTETVYGIGGDGSAANNRLIARVKRREADQPLLLLVPHLEALRASFPGLEWPVGAAELANSFWPGPLTIVVRCPGSPDGLRGPGDGLAVRVSPDPTVAALLAAWGRPMTSSSANLAGREPARTLESALEVFSEREDLEKIERPVLALDAGATRGTLPSTIVSFVVSPPRLLREGAVSRQEVEARLAELL
ncbi:MAG: L-threonylcarbamoyladenylate synthase [Gemmatimonadota bacterium]|nr:MAG: L-threonylcarbamoyladenylate synthase [Gemmatimonadota bacterium]